MNARFELMKEAGVWRSFGYFGAAVGFYAAVMLAVIAVHQPLETGNAVMTLVTPEAQAFTPVDRTGCSERARPAAF